MKCLLSGKDTRAPEVARFFLHHRQWMVEAGKLPEPHFQVLVIQCGPLPSLVLSLLITFGMTVALPVSEHHSLSYCFPHS